VTPRQSFGKQLVRRIRALFGVEMAKSKKTDAGDIADAKAVKLANSISNDRGTTPTLMRHYLYFSSESQAQNAAERLRARGLSVNVRLGADKKNWLALASQNTLQSPDQMEDVRDKMEAIAMEFGGEYDGWEVAIAK
jgi:regulator of ribonuclease activity B